MKKLLLTLGILLLTSPVFAGTTSSNGYFYLPSLGATGASERTTWVNAQEATDAVIQANVNARHSAVTTAGVGTYVTLSGQALTIDQIDLSTDVSNFASSVLAARLTNETGTGAVVFGTSPTIASPTLTGTIGTGLAANRCVQTDGSGNLEAAIGSCSLGAPGTDVIGVDQLDDGTDTATTNDVVMIDNSDTTQFIYIDVPDCDTANDVLQYDVTTQAFSCATGVGVEVNDLEVTDPPSVLDQEIYIGNGTASGTWVTVSGDATLSNAGVLEVTQADALETDPADCAANTFATTIGTNGDLTCASLVDADVPNNITIDLAATATALAADPADCAANQFATTIAASGALTCAGIVDADVPDTITVSNYLPLAGGTLTGEVTADDLGIEFTAGDTLTDCSTFSATGGGIFYDDSEGIFKKCQDNVLTDLDTSGAGESTTAGDYLTLTGVDIDLDAEIYTENKGVWIDNPIVEAIDEVIFFMNAVTITRIQCYTDVGTATLNLENASDADVLSADIVCDAGGQSACASGCDVNTINVANDNFAAFAEGDIDISATASTPGKVSVFIGYTIDDI